MSLFGAGYAIGRIRQRLVTRGSRLPPQLVERRSNRHAVQPAGRFAAMRLRMAPQLPEDFYGQFLGACVVANHAGDDTRGSLVLPVKERLEVEGRLHGFDFHQRLAVCRHSKTTPPGADL